MSALTLPVILLIGCLGIGGVLIVGIIAWGIGLYNGLVKKRLLVDEAQSDIETFLKKRYDMIPNLVEIVKGYAKHEKETLENVVKFRNAAMNASNFDEKIKAENQLTNTLKTLFAVAENYPDLKANQGFLDLQNKLSLLEEDIQKSRRFYNGSVKEYNEGLSVFPANLVAGMLGFKPRAFFEASEEEKENVKISF
ncbi:LemA family protein [Candidatus Dojkabacteria bacterium]|nr:LemA family protein [Candidatus Dojkabacteria bacterium]